MDKIKQALADSGIDADEAPEILVSAVDLIVEVVKASADKRFSWLEVQRIFMKARLLHEAIIEARKG